MKIDILQMSISAAMLIAVTVVLRLVAVNKLPKKTFLTLWGVIFLRLLVPFSIPSKLSVFNLINAIFDHVPSVSAETETITNTAQINSYSFTTFIESKPNPKQININVDPIVIIWIIGFIAVSAFFLLAYIRDYKELRFAVVVKDNVFINSWLKLKQKNKTNKLSKFSRPITIMVSEIITTPIAVGILKPRIIFPKSMDLSGSKNLEYILSHELYHIRRFHALWKLFGAIAVSVHWFNPLVWIGFVFLCRDLELACDEAVIRCFGSESKTAYAYSIINAAEQRRKITPLYNGFSKTAAEERIISIMKYRKSSIISTILAIVVTAGISAIFTASAANPDVTKTPSNNDTPLVSDSSGEITDDVGTDYNSDGHYSTYTLDDDSVIISYVDPETGKTLYSTDNGETWSEDSPVTFPDVELEWWTYEEYKDWLEEEKVRLQEIIGEKGWNPTEGWYEWTQERVDEAIELYEKILEGIKNGNKVSKSVVVNGELINIVISGYTEAINFTESNYENAYEIGKTSYSATFIMDVENGEEQNIKIGPFDTIEDFANVLKEVIEENDNLSGVDVDEFISRMERGESFGEKI